MDIRRSLIGLLSASLTIAIAVGVAGAARPAAGRRAHPASSTRRATIDTDRRIDVNSLNLYLANNGAIGYDLTGTFPGGLFYPKGTSKTAIYASGLWLGATVRDTLRTVVAEYDQEYRPGRLISDGNYDNPSDTRLVTYKVVRWTGDPSDSSHVELDAPDASSGQDPLVHHSWSEYVNGAKPFGAPTKMYRLPPASGVGDSVDVEGPDVLGDMMCWSVYNDGDPNSHTNDAGHSLPLDVQVTQTTFAFNRQGSLGNTVFIKYEFKHVGPDTLENMYVSQWADPDLGGFTDDLVGCDTTFDSRGRHLSLGFVYNATNNDQIYGGKTPAVGYDFFKGPISAGGDTLGLASFNKYINGTDPRSPDETYNFMQGLNADGSDVVDPFGNTTKFSDAGDPVSPSATSWLDTNPADRRFMMSSGPFRMLPGETQTVVVGLIVGQGNDRLSSISALRFNDKFAQDAFDKDFILPSPPPAPKVDASVDHGTVTLHWDAASRTNYNEPGYTFEGYNVYQGETVAGPWKLIATYDEIDNVRVIFDEVFDLATGQTLPSYPVAFGADNGVVFQHTTSSDAIGGGSLKDGKPYYFAVTAYGYNPSGLPKVLENSQATVIVTPQRPASGTDNTTAAASTVTYLEKDATKPPATDVVSVDVVDPTQVTGHTYKVTFAPLASPFVGQVGTDTATVINGWALTDSTTGQVKYSGQLNRRGDDDYRVVDGIRVKVTGQYFPKLQDGAYFNDNTAHRRALTGVNWGLPYFFGGAGSVLDFGAFNTTLDPTAMPDSFTTVELRFGQTQKLYRYFRLEKESDGGAPPQGRSYLYGGYQTCNFQVWDTVKERQLDACFVERMFTDDAGNILPAGQQPATQDSTWDPTSDTGTGDREYLMTMSTPYSDTPKAPFTADGVVLDGAPLMWFLGAAKRADSDVIDAGDRFKWTWASPAGPNDVYVFNTSALVQNNAALAKANLARIRVVPNPYYAHSAYELNQFSRVIKFINMPEHCTVRIFNLAGQLVRTLEKTDASTSILTWNVQTENNLPIASGVYIYHVEVPGVGETVGRLVVFMERERLNNF